MPWRPSKYDPAFPELLLDSLKDGYSLTGFAGLIGVARSTLDGWASDFPEFSEAMVVGRAVRISGWEGRMNRVAERGGGPGTAQVILFALKNMAPDEYRDKQQVEHVGPGGGPLQSVALTPDQFEAVARKVADEV